MSFWDGTSFSKIDRNAATRNRLAQSGAAMPDGSFPIVTIADLHNAIQSIGRASHPEAAKEHIKRRARALGATDQLPDAWKIDESQAKADSPILPTQPSSTANSMYPGVGIKNPSQGSGKATGSGMKSKTTKKPKVNVTGRSGDATASAGAVSSGGPGGSMGSKSEDIWSGSAFAGQGCTDMSPACMDMDCKMCAQKRMSDY